MAAGGGAPRSSPNGKAAAAASGAANPLISSTEKCKVCKEPAAKHIHYGSVTCFSCRAFFRRSIQNQVMIVGDFNCNSGGQLLVTWGLPFMTSAENGRGRGETIPKSVYIIYGRKPLGTFAF